jgi:hypothetical protein
MSEIAIEEQVEPLDPEKLDDYCEAAASVVEELGSFLGSHHAELVKCHIKIHGTGGTMAMPLAHQDPKYAASIHNLKNACDAFCNVMRDNRWPETTPNYYSNGCLGNTRRQNGLPCQRSRSAAIATDATITPSAIQSQDGISTASKKQPERKSKKGHHQDQHRRHDE